MENSPPEEIAHSFATLFNYALCIVAAMIDSSHEDNYDYFGSFSYNPLCNIDENCQKLINFQDFSFATKYEYI